MRSRVSVIAGLLLGFAVVFASAQTKQDGKYVFVISKVNYLKAIEDAVSKSKAEGLEVSEVRVILCGESVKALTEEDVIIKVALQNTRIKLYACGISLEQMSVDPSVLPKEVGTVQNGILEAMKLEKEGYKKFDL